MISLPKSLTGRLTMIAVFSLVIALILGLLVINYILENVVKRALDEHLDAEIALVVRAINPDGSINHAAAIDVPPFDQLRSGWVWEIIGSNETLRSRSLGNKVLPSPPDEIWSSIPRDPPASFSGGAIVNDRPRPYDSADLGGNTVHARVLRLASTHGLVVVIAAAPATAVGPPAHQAIGPLLACFLVLGTFLAVAFLVQHWVGLRPLARLQLLIADVGEGRIHRIDVDEPTEILPLVRALNTLIDTNQKALASARGHVANLAHGLKTPLATLHLDLSASGVDPDGRLLSQVVRMESQINHHLGRARASELSIITAKPLALAVCLHDLIDVMARLHAEKDLKISVEIEQNLLVRCDPQDLDELFGNILDNAWRWARTEIRVTARHDGRFIRVAIDDDGPGMNESALRRALAGELRLDEIEAGHGVGLMITRELVELHGGALKLNASAMGGLAVAVRLLRW